MFRLKNHRQAKRRTMKFFTIWLCAFGIPDGSQCVLWFVRDLYLLHLLTYSMVQSPSWEANWFAASQEITRISRNPKVHYRTHKLPPPVSILGQPNPVHIPTSHLQEIHPNIIHPSTPRSPHWSVSLRFPHQEPIHPPLLTLRATCPAHLILLDFITRTILGEEYRSMTLFYLYWESSMWRVLVCYFLGPLFIDWVPTFNLCFYYIVVLIEICIIKWIYIMKIVQWEPSCSRRPDMTKLIVAFRNFANAPKTI